MNVTSSIHACALNGFATAIALTKLVKRRCFVLLSGFGYHVAMVRIEDADKHRKPPFSSYPYRNSLID